MNAEFKTKLTDVPLKAELSTCRMSVDDYIKQIQEAVMDLQKQNCYVDSLIITYRYDSSNGMDYPVVEGYRPENEKERNRRLAKTRKQKAHEQRMAEQKTNSRRRLFLELKKEFEPQ